MDRRSLPSACALLGLSMAFLPAAESSAKTLNSEIVPHEQARQDSADWGRIAVYFDGDTKGTRASFAATAELKPDSEIHPPHAHVEEEYLLVTKGAGIWVLGDKSFPAKAGDVLYAAPNVLHGIRSAPDSGLSFVVVKFAPRHTSPEPDAP